jgi:hypothetical protein
MDTILHKTDQFGNPNGGQELIFFCPGCKCAHGVVVTHEPKWGWNGNMEKPSFTPSILVNGFDWVGYPQDKFPRPKSMIRCHSFVTDGNIQFLGDCEHELKGQTVPLPVF